MQDTIALITFLFPLAYSPGPGNMFFAANGARFGIPATLRASAGYHIATWGVTAALGGGALTALSLSPNVFLALKLAGSLYVLWIAWGLFNAGSIQGAETSATPPTLRDGAMLLLLNPKAYVSIALMFSQFLPHPSSGGTSDVLRITTIFTLNNLIAFTLWTLLGDRAARRLRSGGHAVYLNRFFGMVLALVALWMLAS
ncbi:LysE family translocator [Pseudothioclava arenosa]|uniref:Lysine transporter LysE n=1 Tax=Pseudothioclava arenosa TaxID=1795308 RepID=A0A2A4CRV0_9RHOB|nr:LysE family translocator [Pseudothioclava arenosa]PCD77325.1 lysine transporter LysE [Pseudothioclava arenosa]